MLTNLCDSGCNFKLEFACMGVVVQLFKENKIIEVEDGIEVNAITSVKIFTGQPNIPLNANMNSSSSYSEKHINLRNDIEALLKTHGVNVSSIDNQRDLQLVSNLLQGMLDKGEGCNTEQSLLFEVMKLTFDRDSKISDDVGSFDYMFDKMQ